MNVAALCIFAWDFADEGAAAVLDAVCGLGVNRLYLASVYHAGYFLHPHNPHRRVRMLEDGVAYFHPDAARYGRTPLKPRVASMCRTRDWFGEICDAAGPRGVGVTAWTVCMHNSRLGLLHPECTVHNAFGDSYPHALSPGHPAAREYLRALVGDLASRYPLASIFLEAPNHRGRRHGHHHERLGVHLGPLEENLFDLSFNPEDEAAGRAAGVDVEALRAAVREHLERYLAAAPHRDAALPETIDAFRARVPALAAYEAALRQVQESLWLEARAIAGEHGVELDGVGDSAAWHTVLVAAYGEPPQRVAAITRAARRGLRAGQKLLVLIRIGFDGPGAPGGGSPLLSATATLDAVRAARAEGADGVVFYNYSEAPRRSIAWIGAALGSSGAPERAEGG